MMTLDTDELQQLSRIQEFRLIQNIVGNLKTVTDFDNKTLADQEKYWLRLTPVNCPEQQERIKIALERHSHMPIEWIANNEIEITVHPGKRLPSFKKPAD